MQRKLKTGLGAFDTQMLRAHKTCDMLGAFPGVCYCIGRPLSVDEALSACDLKPGKPGK
jgi:hypothetical protein